MGIEDEQCNLEEERPVSWQQWCYVLAPLLALAACMGLAYRLSGPAIAAGPRVTPSLRFVIVVSRHGNRGPLFSFPTFPYPTNDSHSWPYGEGQLTRRGRQRLYQLGIKLRSLYHGFLGDYSRDSFQAFSTPVDRTLMSAQVLLAGLFRPTCPQMWDVRLPWQPVPIFNSPYDHTELLATDAPEKLCPRFGRAQAQSMARFYEKYGPNMTSLLESVRADTGLGPGTSSEAITARCVWDPIVCADSEGLSLPSWSSKVYPQPLERIMANAEVSSTVGSDDMVRLLQGQLFQEMVGFLRSKANGSLIPDRSMVLYSGHDMTVRGLQGVLGLRGFWDRMIRPGSALVLELHQAQPSAQHHIQVLYIDGGSEYLEPAPVNIPGCRPPCLLDDLLNITEKYYNITDYDTECRMP